MALQIWMPFTDGTLKQQGLKNVSPTVGGTVNLTNAGKLGKCATIGTAAGGITLPASSMTSFTECSIAFWIKIISWNTSYATFFQAGLGSTPWNNYIFGILRNNANSNLCFTLTNSGGTSSQAAYTTSNLNIGQWYHLTFTYKAGTVSTYIDGVLDKTYSTTYVPNFAGITHISIGRCTNNSGYQTNCNLNDFRIYDHCLSPMEVKQLSQGLVLYYPLNRQGWGQENLLKNSQGIIIDKTGNISGSRTEYYAWDVGDSYTDITTTTTVTISFDLEMYVNDLTTYNGQLNIYNTNNKGPVQLSGKAYTFKNKYAIGETINERISLTTTLVPRADATKTHNYIEFYTGYGSDNFYKISNVKLEFGSIATPWCPHVEDENNMGINGTIEYDCSGYCYNGTWHGTHSNTSDTPKHAVSTTATGSGTTYLEGPVLPAEAKTVALWIKNTSKSSNGAIFNDKTTGLQIGLLNSLLYMNSKTSTAGFTTTHWVNGEWNHVVAINNNGTRSLYVNGQAETQSGASNYYIHNADNCWLWNRSYNNNYPFTGSLCDLRVYATALSADDVKSLYQNCATIDPDGTIRGQIRS